MAEAKPTTFEYYSPAKGRVVARYGSASFIGASRGPKGFRVDHTVVVAIPENEARIHLASYRNALRHGDLIERSKEDYDAYLKARLEKSKARGKAREEAKAEANGDTPEVEAGDDTPEVEAGDDTPNAEAKGDTQKVDRAKAPPKSKKTSKGR